MTQETNRLEKKKLSCAYFQKTLLSILNILRNLKNTPNFSSVKKKFFKFQSEFSKVTEYKMKINQTNYICIFSEHRNLKQKHLQLLKSMGYIGMILIKQLQY
jgi:hypothetical protein